MFNRQRAMKTDFKMLGIGNGSRLVLNSDANIQCRVIGQTGRKSVSFNGEKLSPSLAAAFALGKEKSVGINGFTHWTYDDDVNGKEILSDRRKRIEQESKGGQGLAPSDLM